MKNFSWSDYTLIGAALCLILAPAPDLSAAPPVSVIYVDQAGTLLQDPTPAANQIFGTSFTASDNYVLSMLNSSQGLIQAEFDQHTGQFLRYISPPKVGSAAISGDTAIFGSGGNAAYLYDLSTGQQLRKLTVPNSVALGGGAAIDGTLAVVGDPQFQNQGVTANGALFVFDVNSGNLLTTITHPGFFLGGKNFGGPLAISGDSVLLNGPQDSLTFGSLGTLYQYDANSGQLIRKLTPYINNGRNISVDSGRAAVITNDGAATIFDLSTGASTTIVPPTNPEQFTSVSISGNLLLAGSSGVTVNGLQNAGEAFLYDLTTQQLLARIESSGPQAATYLGDAVQLVGNTAYISAVGLNNYQGGLYVLSVPEPSGLMLAALAAVALCWSIRQRQRLASI